MKHNYKHYICKICNIVISNRLNHLTNWHDEKQKEWRERWSGTGEEQEELFLSNLFNKTELKPVYDQRRYK